MAARQNALSELTRFWLESRHECLIRESIPVSVPYGQSDIDFAAIRSSMSPFALPDGTQIGPRVIVESKDEHDFDPLGRDFGRRLESDWQSLGNNLYLPATASYKAKFTMLKEHHFTVAERLFGTRDFDRLFLVHALDGDVRARLSNEMRAKRVFWLTVKEVLLDLQAWYRSHERPSGLRYTLTGDLFHLLFGFCGVTVADSARASSC